MLLLLLLLSLHGQCRMVTPLEWGLVQEIEDGTRDECRNGLTREGDSASGLNIRPV